MSGGRVCRDPRAHRARWVVSTRHCNYSAFNGYHRTPSEYSGVTCPACPAVWRTKAAYVEQLPDG